MLSTHTLYNPPLPLQELAAPRSSKDTWPVVTTLEVPPQRRSKLMGPGGSTIRKLQSQTGVEVSYCRLTGGGAVQQSARSPGLDAVTAVIMQSSWFRSNLSSHHAVSAVTAVIITQIAMHSFSCIGLTQFTVAKQGRTTAALPSDTRLPRCSLHSQHLDIILLCFPRFFGNHKRLEELYS